MFCMYYGLSQGVNLYNIYLWETCKTQKELSVAFIISENLEKIAITRCK
jgi:hypothetical protein